MFQRYVLQTSLGHLLVPVRRLHVLFGADGRLPSTSQRGFVLATAQSAFGPFESRIKTLRNGVVCWQKTQ